MHVNDIGQMVRNVWDELPTHFPSIETDTFIVMPNHIHGIVQISDPVGAGSPRPVPHAGAETAPLRTGTQTPLRTWTLGQIVAYFKYQSTKQINGIRNLPGVRLWQRGYYERVIRNERELEAMRSYIANNALKWDVDPEHPPSS